MTENFNWDAAKFFKRLTETNKHAIDSGYSFSRVSSLEGFLALISKALSSKAYVAVSDTSSGSLSINNSPHTRRVKTVFLFMRHKTDDMEARERCMENMRELFRQFMSVLLLEKTKLDQDSIYIDDRISFTEIDRYFYTGGACAFFQISVDTFTNLVYNPNEWTDMIK